MLAWWFIRSGLSINLFGCLLLCWGEFVALAEGSNLVARGQWPGFPRGPAYSVAVQGDQVYVAVQKAGLLIIDGTNPAKLSRLGGYDTVGDALDVAVAGHYAYIADGQSGLQIIDSEVSLSKPRFYRAVGP